MLHRSIFISQLFKRKTKTNRQKLRRHWRRGDAPRFQAINKSFVCLIENANNNNNNNNNKNADKYKIAKKNLIITLALVKRTTTKASVL